MYGYVTAGHNVAQRCGTLWHKYVSCVTRNPDTWHVTPPTMPIKMSEQVIIKVRPGESIHFPGRCVNCGRPGRDRLRLAKRHGQVTRRVDAPLCAECARTLSRRSGREEQLLRLSWPAAVVAGLLLAFLVFVVLPGGWPLRLVAGAALGLASGTIVRRLVNRRAAAEELPEKRAVREAARIVDFTWRDMTLAFVNDEIAAEVRALNDATGMTEADESGEPAASDELAAEPVPVE